MTADETTTSTPKSATASPVVVNEAQQYFTFEIAELSGLEVRTIAQYIRRGQLDAKRRGRYYVVAGAEVARFLKEHRFHTPPEHAQKPAPSLN